MSLMWLLNTIAHLFHPRRSNYHRPRILHPDALIALMVIAIGFTGLVYGWTSLPGETGRVLGFASSISPNQVIEQTNAQRISSGLSPLTTNSLLNAAALAKGQHMFANQYWAHTAPDGTSPWTFIRNSGYSYQVAGENLARDFSDTGGMVQAWMASPTHQANIMNTRYQETGVAVIDGTLQGVETTLVVQMFGTPQSLAAVKPKPTVGPTAPATVSIEEAAPILVSPKPTTQPTSAPAELVSSAPTEPEPVEPEPEATVFPGGNVLAGALVPQGSIIVPPLFTPLQLLKAFFLGLIMMIVLTLIYDTAIIGHRSILRLVGKNLAHLTLWFVVAFLLLFFKGGIVG